MPAIAAPPFSINPFHQVPAAASLTIPSYAGVTVPQVTGLNGEVIMSSTTYPSHQLSDVPSTAAQLPAAVIPHFPHPHDDGAVSLATVGAANAAAIAGVAAAASGGRPSHPVNQVSVVVDPRMNPSAVLQPAEVAPNTGLLQALQGEMSNTHMNPAGLQIPSVPSRPLDLAQEGWMLAGAQPARQRSQDIMGNATPSPVQSLLQSIPTASINTSRPSDLPPAQNWDLPGPSGLHFHRPLPSHSPSASTPSSDSSGGSLFSPLSSMADLPDSDSEYSSHATPFMHVDGASPQIDSSSQSTPSVDESSPGSQQGGMSSALQTLADAALLLSESPQTDSPTLSEENSPTMERGRGGGGGGGGGGGEGRGRQGGRQREERGHPIVMGEADELYARGAPSISFPQSAQLPQPNIHHTGALPPTLAAAEDLPVFLPVIHPANEASAHAHLPSVPVSVPSGTAQRIVYPPQERAMNVAIAVIPEVPPLIHMAQGPHSVAPVSEHYWPSMTAPVPIAAPHPIPTPGHHPGPHAVVPRVQEPPPQAMPPPPPPQQQQQLQQQQQHQQQQQQQHLMQAVPHGRQQAASSFWDDVMVRVITVRMNYNGPLTSSSPPSSPHWT